MCFPETCDHVYLFDNDYEDAKDIYGKPMSGRFPYDRNGRIIVEVEKLILLSVFTVVVDFLRLCLRVVLEVLLACGSA